MDAAPGAQWAGRDSGWGALAGFWACGRAPVPLFLAPRACPGKCRTSGAGFGQALGRVTPSCPPAFSRRRSGPPPRLLAPRVPVRFAGLPFHMAGTRRGLARRAGRRTHPPAQAGEAGDRGTCGEGVTVGQQPRPPGEGTQAEDKVTSGQQSSALPKGLSGLPTPSFPSHVPTCARAPTLAPRASTSRTHSRTATPAAAHHAPHMHSHRTRTHTPLRTPVPFTRLVLRLLTQSLLARSTEHWPNDDGGVAAAGTVERPPYPPWLSDTFIPPHCGVLYGALPHSGGGRGHRGAVFSPNPWSVTKSPNA